MASPVITPEMANAAASQDQVPIQQASVPDQIAPVPVPPANPSQPGPQQPATQPPVQVVAAHPRAHVFNAILNTLGGGDKTQYSVDPQTGTMGVTRVPQTKGQLAKSILAGAVAGLFSGASQSSGAGAKAFGDAGQAGVQRRQQQDAQARQQAQQDYEQQQKAILQKAQVMNLNMRTAHDAFELADMQEKDIQQHVDQFKNQLENIPESAVTDTHVPADQMMKKGYNAGKLAGIPDGTAYVYDADGKVVGSQPTYTVYDPTGSAPLSKLIDPQEAKQWGVAPFSNMADVSKLPDTATSTYVAAQTINNEIATRKLMLGELNRMQAAIDPKSAPITPEQFQKKIASDPNPKALVDAMKVYQRTAMNQSTEPDGRLDALRQANPQAAGEIMNFIGPDKFQAFKEARTNREAAGKSAAEEAGKLSVAASPAGIASKTAEEVAKAGAEASTPLGKAKLLNEQLGAENKGLENKKLKQEVDLISADAGDPTLKGDAYLKSLPPGQQALYNEIGTGHMTLNRLEYIAARKPEILAGVARAFPDYDYSKAISYPATYKDFTEGKTSRELVSGGTAMQHLAELKNLNTYESRVKGTADYQRYQDKLDTVASELAAFYGNSTIPGIAGYKKTLGAFFNRDAAIETQAQSMGDRFDSYENKWKNAAPSSAYQAPLPNVSVDALMARAALDPKFAQTVRVNPQTKQVIKWNGKQWVDTKTEAPVQ